MPVRGEHRDRILNPWKSGLSGTIPATAPTLREGTRISISSGGSDCLCRGAGLAICVFSTEDEDAELEGAGLEEWLWVSSSGFWTTIRFIFCNSGSKGKISQNGLAVHGSFDELGAR